MSQERSTEVGRFGVSALMVYVWAVIAVGAGVVAASALVALDEGWASAAPGLALLFTASMLVAEMQPISRIRKEETGVVTVSMAYSVALIFLLPGYLGAVVVALGSAVADVARRLPAVKVCFNAATMVITMATGIVVLRANDIQDLDALAATDLRFLLLVVVAMAAVYSTNALLIGGVIARVEGAPMVSIIRRDFFVSLPTDGLLLPLGPLLVIIGVEHPVMLPFAMVLTGAVYRSARSAAERTRDATIDPLTDLVNRRLFDESAEAAMERAQREDVPAAILLLDLDNFKEINDTLGHHVGDAVLIEVARRLEAAAPPDAVVARLGGDEFAVLLPRVTDADAAVAVAERVAGVFHDPVPDPDDTGGALPISGSIGVALSSESLDSVGAVARAADAAMYQAKRAGLNVVLADSVFDDGDAAERELAEAIQAGDLSLAYQPIIDTRTRMVTGLEALVRWNHERHGMIPPSDFVPLAESGPLIRPLTSDVLRQALDMLEALHSRGYQLVIAVNVSVRNLADPTFAAEVTQLLAERTIAPESLTLEITESAVMEDLRACRRTLHDLRALGIGLALDDFGAGYSSLGQLRDLPVTTLKIDRSFIRDLDTERGRSLLRTFVELARSMGLRTTAEGIEELRVLEFVQQAGCDQAQGFHIGRPMPQGEALAWLAGRASIDPFISGSLRELNPETIR